MLVRIAALGDSLTYGYGVRRTAAWPHLLAESLQIPVDNFGISGDTTGGMLARFAAQVMPSHPTHLILMGGGNDLIMGLGPVVAASNLKTIIYQAAQERIRIVLGLPVLPDPHAKDHTLLPPSEFPKFVEGREAVRQSMLEFSKNGLFQLVDFQTFVEGRDDMYLDGLHLNENGNRVVAEQLTKIFKK